MKKSLLALAAFTAFAGVASAQSSVTLFGVVDVNLKSVDNGSAPTLKTMSKNGIASSRLGFRGVEDLGGGLRAGFWIEGDTDPDTGGTGQTWTRRSTVSLIGGFGELRLGRDFTPTFLNTTVFDPYGTNGVGNSLNLLSTLGSGATTLVRSNNGINYFLPAMGGLYGHFQVAAGENIAGNKYVGGRLGYAAGPVNVAASLGRTAKDGAMVDDFRVINFAGSFKVGAVNLMGQYNKHDYSVSSQKAILLGATMALGANTLKASYIKSSGNIGAGAARRDLGATQMAFGFQHDLSKRTALYATYSRINNDGTTATGSLFQLGNGAAGMLRGQTATGYEFGVRHIF